MTGNVNQLQGNILEVDDHCRRTGDRLDALEIQDTNDYSQEHEPVIELDGESEYDDDRTETTHDSGALNLGSQSASSLDGMASIDGASVVTAPHDITFSQRVPLFPSPKPRATPHEQQQPSPTDEYPTDPDAQVEWHENKLNIIQTKFWY